MPSMPADPTYITSMSTERRGSSSTLARVAGANVELVDRIGRVIPRATRAAEPRPILATSSTFAPATLAKVERLLEILDVFSDDPILGRAFVLHGGTALNMFLDELPRLSID